jgi:hypothetical protein
MLTISPVSVGVGVGDAEGEVVVVVTVVVVVLVVLVAAADGDPVGVRGALDEVAMTLPSGALISWAPSLTGARLCGASRAIAGAGGGVGAVPNEMRMSLAASCPVDASVALWSMVTV